MIRMNIVKWAAASAIALATVPAIGFARHASHVSAAPQSSAETNSIPSTEGKSKSANLATTKSKKHKHHVKKKHATAHTKSHKSTRHHAKKKHHIKK